MPTQEFSQRIDNIRQMYETQQGADLSPLLPLEHLLHHVSDALYSTDFRFVMELIQNAVDSHKVNQGKPVQVRVRFHLQDDKLIVANDGQPFSREDVDRICGVTKRRKGLNKIGYKGIGFKSVAAITHNPQIYSANCYFEFDKAKHPLYDYAWLIIPHWIPPEELPSFAQDPDWVTFVLPFRPDRRLELLTQFDSYVNTPSGALLLFLENLAELEIKNDPVNKYLRLRKQVNHEGLTVIQKQQINQQELWQEYGRWLVVSHTIDSHPQSACLNYMTHRHLKAQAEQEGVIDLGETKISIAFHISPTYEFNPKGGGPVYAFFLVDHEKSGLRFTIQADFLTVLNRESLVPNSLWNDWLMENLPAAIETAIMALKGNPKLHHVIYQALPLAGEGQGKFKEVVEALLADLQNQPIILTNQTGQNQWVEPIAAVWVQPNLRSLLQDKDLPYLLPQKRAFASLEINHEDKRVKALFETLGIEKIDNEQFLKFLQNREWLKTKAHSWFVPLFQHLMTLKGGQQKEALKHLPIIPTTGGLAKASDDKLFLPSRDNLTVTGAKLVAHELASALNVVDFLHKELGLQTVTPVGLVEQVIIPALKQPTAALTPAIRQEYLKFVAAHYPDLPQKIRQSLTQYLLIEAQDGSWQPLNHLYLAEKNRQATLAHYLLEQNLPSKYLVADSPFVEFYQQLGLATAPTLETLEQLLHDWDWLAEKDLTWFQVLYSYLADQNVSALRALLPIYIQNGQLLTAADQVYFWPDSFDPDLFSNEKVNFVSPDLFDTPLKSSGFVISATQIQSCLERVGITDFKPLEIINRTVVAEFEKAAATDHYAAKLLDYTVFTLKTLRHTPDAATLETVRGAIQLKTTTGEWHLPPEIYLTEKYGVTDFETLLADLPVYFISPDYLDKYPDPMAWFEFLSDLGAKNQLQLIHISSAPKERLDKLAQQFPSLDPYWQAILDTQLEGKDAPDLHKLSYHRVLKHISLSWLTEIITQTEVSRLEILLTLLAELWQPDLIEVQYERWWQQKALPIQTRPSHLAWSLLNHAILPTHQGLKKPLSQPIYNDSPAIRELVGEGVAYLTMRLEPGALAEFLGVVTQASQVKVEDVKNQLRWLKVHSTAQVETCLKIYQFLAQQGDYGVLEREQLVYAQTAARQWWSPSELFWQNHHELFGTQRGYLSTVYPPHAKAIFEKIRVNVGQPTPHDWANLLCTQPNDLTLIGRAYGELDEFLRTEPTEEALTWWNEFAQKVTLLTESGEFINPTLGIYLPDVSTWHEEFKSHLPFLALGGKVWQQYSHFLTKLGLRHLSDWLFLNPQTSPELYEENADKLRAEITENCPFMYSILAAKTGYDNQAKEQFEPKLLVLLKDKEFQVKLVASLEVEASIPNHPEIKAITHKKQAFYHIAHKTLYVSILNKKSIPREVGIAVATIFEGFEDKVDSYFAHLFVTSGKVAKGIILQGFNIRFIPWPEHPIDEVEQPIDVPWPKYQPNEVKGEIITLDQWLGLIKETPMEYSAKPPQTELDEAMKKKVGDWGEVYAMACLSQKFSEEYQAVETMIEWNNASSESGEPFDIKTTDPNVITYWEVKATPGEFQEWFMSMQEWLFAAKQGDNYHVLRVFNAGTDNAYVVDLPNPVKLWEDKKLTIGHNIRVGLA